MTYTSSMLFSVLTDEYICHLEFIQPVCVFCG